MKNTFYVLLCAFSALFALPSAAQVPAYVPTDGLVGWWPFNGNANDESGNGNDGVATNLEWGFDRFNQANSAADFNLVANRVIEVTSPSNVGGNFKSISIWFKIPNTINQGSFYNQMLFAHLNSTNYVECMIYGNNPSYVSGGYANKVGYNSNPPANLDVADSNWHHVVYLLNGDLNTLSVYIDGLLLQNIQVLENNLSSWNVIYFGNNPIFGAASQTIFGGSLDDISIYNRALTEQEIQNLYTGTIPPPCSSLPSNLQNGLVGYWPFCGNANDESGNGNDGAVNGAVLTEDRFGNANSAFNFDGNDWIAVPDNNSLDITQELTLSAWLNLSIINPYNCIISKDINATDQGYRLDILNDKLRMIKANLNNGQGNTNVYTNEWIHALVTFKNDTVNYYFNGINDGTYIAPGSITPTTNNLTFGVQNQISPMQYVSGSLDDIGIWNRALTPQEVQELYTLNACTFTVFDTVTTYETVYDTLYTNVTIYDTVTTYVTVTDTLLIDITFVGFEGQPSWLNTVVVYPNPASDHITIHYGNYALMAGYNTVITDAGGATVYSSAVNSQLVDIDINAWGAAGVYYMSIYDANGGLVAMRHIVLQ